MILHLISFNQKRGFCLLSMPGTKTKPRQVSGLCQSGFIYLCFSGRYFFHLCGTGTEAFPVVELGQASRRHADSPVNICFYVRREAIGYAFQVVNAAELERGGEGHGVVHHYVFLFFHSPPPFSSIRLQAFKLLSYWNSLSTCLK